MTMAFIDASGQVMGRLCSVIAKRLLGGEEVVVVNAEKALITGSREDILEEFRWRRRVGSQRKGPYYPRTPEMILKRAVRGMLPRKKTKGKDALKKLRVYVSVPDEYVKKKLEKVEEASSEGIGSFVTLDEISKHLGARL